MNSAANTHVGLPSLTAESIHILAKDLKSPWFDSLDGRLTTRSQTKGNLDRVNAISKSSDFVAKEGLILLSLIGTLNPTSMWSEFPESGGALGSASCLCSGGDTPSSQNAWEPEDRLRDDCPKAVEMWDQQ
ncbi:Hypothetical protein PHPALM_20323 [Phytophthora palmivora]|uniref:Uncharacterized protein n=1 Tax=Phytophthora palmivora TaxID=4796 RepID=A0A2P4XF68_9STRA|nr:Hypothetical protein PHPALM_20323 [Phytophthora palmivora]